jgi:RimJ/RimL family protein N-acetyltransferase
MHYLFESERLAFRNWIDSDLIAMHSVNSDPEVMHYFPAVKTKEETLAFIERMQSQFAERKYCYFPVVLKASQEVIGFIGLAYQTFVAPFNPSVDIGWRLSKRHWGKGYATEGAKACLKYAFEELKIEGIISIASTINVPSLKVMEKIGMKHMYDFEHPLLENYPEIRTCSLFKIRNSNLENAYKISV